MPSSRCLSSVRRTASPRAVQRATSCPLVEASGERELLRRESRQRQVPLALCHPLPVPGERQI
ncbi:hypothetical protein M6B38_223670 [Iris pallida]|uniref:Uncharacterized protein n=1 Tax=Iris pallida TaxID=29817 RepID=A0AAX6DVW1_IRIPA|nr:hypothetical protein M6B38_223670 [Iris pallida]